MPSVTKSQAAHNARHSSIVGTPYGVVEVAFLVAFKDRGSVGEGTSGGKETAGRSRMYNVCSVGTDSGAMRTQRRELLAKALRAKEWDNW